MSVSCRFNPPPVEYPRGRVYVNAAVGGSTADEEELRRLKSLGCIKQRD